MGDKEKGGNKDPTKLGEGAGPSQVAGLELTDAHIVAIAEKVVQRLKEPGATTPTADVSEQKGEDGGLVTGSNPSDVIAWANHFGRVMGGACRLVTCTSKRRQGAMYWSLCQGTEWAYIRGSDQL